ncbi:MAG: hypothetical protein ACYC92_00485 [Candidatus Acidiferrales bacterium]
MRRSVEDGRAEITDAVAEVMMTGESTPETKSLEQPVIESAPQKRD